MVRLLACLILGFVLFWVVGIALFERLAPRRIVRSYRRAAARMFAAGAGRVPGWVLLETVGRRSRARRLTPVGARLAGDTVWIVAGHDWRPDYLYNIEATPEVRVRVRGRWRSGRATVCPEDDARRRAMWTNAVNGIFLLIACAKLVTVRVDLEPRRG